MTHKILTVDDSKTIRLLIKRAFKAYDCELFEAENGVEALAVAAREKPDLIILDITMPVMTGVDALAQLKGDPELKEIPVVMLTAESGKDYILRAVQLGAKDYVVKPFKGDTLIERLTKFLPLQLKA